MGEGSLRLVPPSRPLLHAAVAFAPLVFVAVIQGVKLVDPIAFVRWVHEDGPVESLQFLTYALASGFAAAIATAFLRRGERHLGAMYAVLGVGLGLVALEEVAWGQRLLDFRTPEFFAQRNVQRELTLHNLEPIQEKLRYILFAICAYGAFAHLLAPRVLAARYAWILRWVVPGRWLFFYFFPGVVFYAIVGFLRFLADAPGMGIFAVSIDPRRTFVVWQDQEPIELLLSLGFLLLLVASRLALRSLPRS
jgi:hypothetical protein